MLYNNIGDSIIITTRSYIQSSLGKETGTEKKEKPG